MGYYQLVRYRSIQSVIANQYQTKKSKLMRELSAIQKSKQNKTHLSKNIAQIFFV